ncbi:glutathione S-transferase family protein [Hydrogenophaga palleronii]|uniref:glutathione S-transferase family protein n=1 Tax=Hydrogenophaga palleronii TaxID=65655 RepID=UPI000824CD86|nr:glutathione S-transferase family protein [Hydrogenophaga palleronii]
MSLVLYYSPGACSMAVHIALHEAGVAYERRSVSVNDGETQSAAYLQLNPRGRVPALVVDGHTTLVETCAVLLYIARRFPAAQLLPQDPLREAQCMSILAWLASTVHPTFAHVVKPGRFSHQPEALDSIRNAGMEAYWAALQEVDALIGAAGPWVFGERFTVCDAHALPFWGFGRRMRLPMETLTHYTAWKDRMVHRPAVLAVLQAEDSRLLRAA